ncbi:DUF2306 domain-containing protein [Pelagibacterium lentulum]|uniref:Membrane protein n=1 Tax=Pelagibacterium lentulum TaxID=2029865 RepID=A0A916R6T0_9HYPH|nr:DUF2306 domain-containing protein [Pelagibacterium lentulum]GGA41787.1 membrane protein [Pelagibacterium lentulum]
MIIEPIALASPAIRIHTLAALLALVLGTIVLFMPKGTHVHKLLGRVWLATMAVTALSSLLITEARMFGPFSWIHGLSVFTLIMLVYGLVQARRGNIVAHRSTMISLYAFALVLTGAFTLLPGRRMNAVLFADGGKSAALFALGVGVVLLLAFWARYHHRSSRRLIRSR